MNLFPPSGGPQFGSDDISSTRHSEIAASGCAVQEVADKAVLCRRTAEAIAHGKVVGWFQGRMEWGPRALGNRSIVFDPHRADMKAIFNANIKRRESFRPFAPSVLQEAVKDWFEEEDDVPFMMPVFQIREEKRALLRYEDRRAFASPSAMSEPEKHAPTKQRADRGWSTPNGNFLS